MPELAVQQKLGPYLLLREVGRGRTALVFEALDTRTQGVVAVKLLKTPGLSPERRAEAVARLDREAGMLARFSHPAIVALREGLQHEAGPAGGFDFLVLEYLNGPTLRTRLSRRGMAPDAALYLLEQLAEALDILHAAGIVHRDLRPANLLRLRSRGIKLIDFGSAGPVGESVPPSSGSPAYIAPELLQGRPATSASDLWSLGVLLYEMLAGRPPFEADTREALLRRIAHDDPAPLPPAYAQVEGVVRRALTKDPQNRYPSARALVQDLADAVGVPTGWSLEPASPPSASSVAPIRPARRWKTAAAAAAALLIVGLATPMLLRHPSSQTPADVAPVRVRIAAARQERHPGPEVLLQPNFGAADPPVPSPVPAARAAASDAADYSVTALGSLGQDVQGLNDHGQLVGGLNGFAVLWNGESVRRLDPPPVRMAPAPDSEAVAINNHGQVVGFAHDHAMLWQAGQWKDLGVLTPSPSSAAGVNDQGQVVGTSHGHAVLWRGGQVTDLGTLGGAESHARAISDRGQVVGVADTAQRNAHAFLWQDGAMRDLGTLGGPSSMALAINNRGQVAGLSITGTGATHAFLWQDGRMKDLGALSGDSQACGLGPRGEVVGTSAGHAVLWRGGRIVDLNRMVGPSFAGTLRRAVAVNAPGQILCFGQRRGSVALQAYLLTPVPSLLSASNKAGR